eukprot:UN02009
MMKAALIVSRKSLSVGNICPKRTLVSASTSNQNSVHHWSFSPCYPSKTLEIPTNADGQFNDEIFESFMKSRFDGKLRSNKEKLSLCHKSQKLTNLFDDVSIKMLDNVLQKKIMSQASLVSLREEECGSDIESWMLFNYEKHKNPTSWMLRNNRGYDANGVVICGLNSSHNKVYQIGPIILNKQYL